VASVLTVNCLLNDLENVRIVGALCGLRGSAVLNSSIDGNNFGSRTFKVSRSLFDRIYELHSSYFRDLNRSASVLPLDDVARDKSVSLIKVDAEGMELDVLKGAQEIIEKCHPVIFCEQNDTVNLARIYDVLKQQDYRLYWLETHPFNQNNFRRQAENIWWRTETGVLAIHRSIEARSDLAEATRNDTQAPAFLNAREGFSSCARELRSLEHLEDGCFSAHYCKLFGSRSS